MATYKKGFKKQNAETVLLKVIIGIIISVFAFVALAFIYEASTAWRTYDHYTLVTEYDGIMEYTNGTDTALEDYVVYFYSDTCTNCETAKLDVLRDGNKLNKSSDFFFLANVDTMSDETNNMATFLDTIGMSSSDVTPTPLLIVVANGEFYGAYSGATSVVDTMDSIADGTFEAFND